MKRNVVSGTILLLLIGMSTLTFNLKTVQASPETILYIDPSSVVDPTLTPGSSFMVDIYVFDAIDLYDWQVLMYWEPSVLDAIDVVFGGFLAGQPEGSMMMQRIEDGWLAVAETTLGKYPGVDGDGWLCSVTFFVENVGETVLDIDNEFTYYQNSLSITIGDDPGELIKENGYFNNFGAVVISSTLDIDPDTLNLKSKGRWVKAYLELPEDYDVNDIDISTVKLNGEILAELHPTEIGDYNEDGVPDLMVKFDRAEMMALLSTGEATLTITGEVNGTPFEGSDTIRVIDK